MAVTALNLRLGVLSERAIAEEVGILASRARERIEESGWWQGDLEGPGGQFCALGALSKACADRYPFHSYDQKRMYFHARTKLACWLTDSEAVSSPTDLIALWNDEPERARDQVLEAFADFAKELGP